MTLSGPSESMGRVWLIGAGPGDPGLITVKGRRLLRTADAVLYDALSHPALLDECRPDAELRNVGKRAGERSAPQEVITHQLIELARRGLRVARLKGGDPFLFARGAEEAEALAAAGVPFEIVPGISSPVATSAYAGISMTHRDLSSSVTFITGSDREGKPWTPSAWHKLATATDTLCIVMGMRRLEAITQALVDGGRSPSTPTAVVQWGSWARQRVEVGTLSDIAARVRALRITNPSVVIVGEVASLRERLAWFDTQPLFGRRLLIPRPAHQGKETAQAVRERGAEPHLFPLIEIVDPPEPALLEAAVDRLAQYSWVLFTSVNGVDRFFSVLEGRGLDARAFRGARIGAIGPRTARALAERGLYADVTAREFIGEALAKSVTEVGDPGRVLIPRALEARDALPLALRAAGAEVDVVPAYQTRPVAADEQGRLVELLRSGGVDTVLFTSSSMVTSFASLLGEDAADVTQDVVLACIGPITARTAEGLGLRVDVEACEYTVPGLLDALERFFVGHKVSGA